MLGNTSKPPLRRLLPAIAQTAAASHVPHNNTKQQRQSLACSSCQKRRTKCSGSPPCDQCIAANAECIFDARRDRRRKFALKTAEHTKDTLIRLIDLLRQGTPYDILKLKAHMESCVSDQEAMERLPLFLTNPGAACYSPSMSFEQAGAHKASSGCFNNV
ncbi:hypothetical protein ASPCAL10866 [Aspergillus calidoustus]|uniref:Zn(2)-C6 fungal-type domain-containing protein n=1 Tax=Aspergillus calidoustus TaxID=454130 RepID=A0A0U5GD88_ASPCI|nr:hypothetical protein ASPCAL10866 [Aspergillus calidoustus]